MMSKSQKKLYGVILFGALVGFIASFWQLLEKLTLLKNSAAPLSCNLNSVFSCTNVLNAPQSSVFGFPNSLLCIILFTIAIVAAIVGLTGTKITRGVRFSFQFLALFTVFFGLWYLWQSIFNLGAMCIFCVFCFGGVLTINAAWFRLNYSDYPISKSLKRKIDVAVANGADIFFWCLIGLIVVAEAVIKFTR